MKQEYGQSSERRSQIVSNIEMENKDLCYGKNATEKFVHQFRFQLKAHYFRQYNIYGTSRNIFINPAFGLHVLIFVYLRRSADWVVTQSHISHIQHTSVLPTLILTSVVHHPTTSFNPILIHSNTTPPFCPLVTQISQSLHSSSCPASLEQTPASIATIV